MKPLNNSAITTAYFHFLGQFFLLMVSLVLITYAFLTTFTRQMQLLRVNRDQYDNVLFTQRLLGQKADSIYADLSVLNTGLVRAERPLEQRILRQEDELNELLQRQLSERHPHEVYRRVAGCVHEMLVLKDSIHNLEGRIRDVRRDLRDCQQSNQQQKN